MGRGKIRHRPFEIQSYNDDIEGHVKVDDWNLKYKKKKKRLKKKKADNKYNKRM